MYKKLHTYFVGIGGIGMSGIAEILLNLGYPVSGSDIKKSDITNRLSRLGAKVHIGHFAKNIKGVDVLVVSSAIVPSNPEVCEAKRLGISVIQRADMLAEIMRLAKYGIAVAGSHGKTTTTSLLAAVLHAGKQDPTVIIGGQVKSLKATAKLGQGNFMLAEADESDGSFLKLAPTIAIVTNIDPEHMDHYKTFDALTAAFCQFCSRLPFYGLAILCGEQAQTVALSKKIKNRYVLYGFSPKHDYNAQNISYQGTTCCYDLYKKNVFVDQIQVNVPGKHNILNSLAAVAAGDEIGISVSNIKKGLAGFQGVGRRLEVLFKNKNMTVIDDYGHHPSEIAATIKTVKHTFPGRLVVMFQPHRYTRTRDLFPDFVTCFDRADHLFITDIYAASEPPIRGVNSQKLVTAINKHKQRSVVYLPKAHQNLDQVVQAMRPGDVLLSLGAGDITKMVRNIARELARIFI